MLDYGNELSRLRHYLNNRDWTYAEIEEIIQLAARDIDDTVVDIVSNAIAETTEYAVDLGAEEFIEDMDVVEMGGGFMIATKSGRTDYSLPERKMLPSLLKNAEVSEDGTRYKKIPVGGKSKRQMPRDIFTMMQQKQEAIRKARDDLRHYHEELRSSRANQMVQQFRGTLQKRLEESRAQMKSNPAPKDVEIRTASEKQDPNTSWVIPAREMDMTGYIMDMNRRIQESINYSIDLIIDSYEKEFA